MCNLLNQTKTPHKLASNITLQEETLFKLVIEKVVQLLYQTQIQVKILSTYQILNSI